MKSVTHQIQTKNNDSKRPGCSNATSESRVVISKPSIPEQAGNMALQNFFQSDRYSNGNLGLIREARLPSSKGLRPMGGNQGGKMKPCKKCAKNAAEVLEPIAEGVGCHSADVFPSQQNFGSTFKPMFGDQVGTSRAKTNSVNHTKSDVIRTGVVSSDFGAGSKLSQSLAAPFENSYGESLSNVRVHIDSKLPIHYGWDALTLGSDIAFAPGRFRPQEPSGLGLIGHELAHVVQQQRGGYASTPTVTESASNGTERQAWMASYAALSGRPSHLSGAPLEVAGGSAGGCFRPGVPATVIGMQAHRHIQSYYNALGIYSEVRVGAGNLQADLVYSVGPPAVPTGQTAAIRPPGYLTSPPHPAPDACGIGEIKPISSLGSGAGPAQLASYIGGMNAYYTGLGGSPNTGTLPPIIPPILISGDPSFILWPPQMLHLASGGSGMFYYMCRPMGELLPVMEYLAERLREWLERMKELMEQNPPLIPVFQPILEPIRQLLEAIEQALEAAAEYAWDHFWEILAVVAIIVVVVLVVVFFAEIVAAIAAVAAAVAAAVEALLASMALALEAFAALMALFGLPAAALAQEPERPPERSPEHIPSQPRPPGCFPKDVRIRLADGRQVPITAVKIGSDVIAWDENNDLLRPCQVTRLHKHEPEALIEILLDNGNCLVVSYFHTIRMLEQWVLAKEIKAGDILRSATDDLCEVKVLEVRPSNRWEPVYNLSVCDCETFVAEGVVVHNTGLAKNPIGPSIETPSIP